MSNQGPPSGWQPSGGWQPPPSQPPPPPPPPQYGYGQPAPGTSAQTETSATVALVLAIVSFVVCPVIPAVIALFLAASATKKIRQSGGRLTGEGIAKAARIIAWVNLALWAVIALIVIIAAVLGAGDEDELGYGLHLAQMALY